MIYSGNNIDNFTDKLLHHCVDIAKGECSIDEQMIVEAKSDTERQLLYALLVMYEEIEYSKEVQKKKLTTEFELKLLREKNLELEQFAYKASHDLKEPIRTIQAFSNLLSNKFSNVLHPKALEYLNYIDTSTRRMNNLIAYLLDYAKYGNTFEKSEFNVGEVVENVCLDLKSQIKESNGKVLFDNLPMLNADRTLIRQLFQNIISNGLKYAKKGVSPVVRILCKSNASDHLFTISDNGIGIDQKDIKNLFEIFTRAKSAEEYEGTGIGLAHCKKIVDLHQGKIWAESTIGQGTQIMISL